MRWLNEQQSLSPPKQWSLKFHARILFELKLGAWLHNRSKKLLTVLLLDHSAKKRAFLTSPAASGRCCKKFWNRYYVCE